MIIVYISMVYSFSDNNFKKMQCKKNILNAQNLQ